MMHLNRNPEITVHLIFMFELVSQHNRVILKVNLAFMKYNILVRSTNAQLDAFDEWNGILKFCACHQ